MTWPLYQVAVARVEGRLTRLTRKEADTLAALLIAHPERGCTKAELADAVYDNPDVEPDTALTALFPIIIMQLRDKGITIITKPHGYGYRIPAEARGCAAKYHSF